MKAKYLSSLIGSGLGACLLLCASVASASTTITFSVDMTFQVQAGTFVPGTDNVSVHGTFNTWGTGLTLTNNPAAEDTNVYSGIVTDTAEANPSLTMYKFVNSNPSFSSSGGYESTGDNGNNRMYVLPATSGQSVVLPTVFFADEGVALGDGVTNNVTFQVDMAQQIATGAFNTNANTIEVHGLFNGWGVGALTADPTILRTNSNGLVTSNVYTGTFNTVAFSPGQNADYKFVIGPMPTQNYESLSGQLLNENPNNNDNRFFTVSPTNNASLTNPVVFFSDAPYAPISTNNVLFQVDMTTEIERGRFVPGFDTLELQGGFTGWGNTPLVLSPNLSGSNTNIYTNSFTFVQGIGSTEQQFKYVNNDVHEPNGGYDQPAPNGQNRVYTQVAGANVVLTPVYFSDIAPMNWVPITNNITFTVDMTGAVEAGTGNAFDPSSDQVYINGDFIYVNNAPWANGLWDIGTLASYQLTNNPVGSSNYSITLGIPATPGAGNVEVNYNYGIFDGTNANNVANEGVGNHVRWIRNLPAGGYNFPTDKFGNNVSEGTAFNMLPAGSPTNGHVAIAWLGVPNVHLQASTNVAGPTWIDFPATDGTNWTTGYASPNGFVSVTNWPLSNPQHYFRLVQPYIAP